MSQFFGHVTPSFHGNHVLKGVKPKDESSVLSEILACFLKV